MLLNRVVNYGKQLVADSVRDVVNRGQEFREDFNSFDPETGHFHAEPASGEMLKEALTKRTSSNVDLEPN